MKNINNYSNIELPKNISNTYKLYLNAMRFQADSDNHTGQYLQISDINGEIIPAFAHNISDNTVEVNPDSVNNGNNRNSIYEALVYASSLNPGANNIILIDVMPGRYLEIHQLTIPEYVYIKGRQQNACDVILDTALSAGQGFINITNNNCGIRNITINANSNADYSYHLNGGTQAVSDYCTITGGNVSILHLTTSDSLTAFIRSAIYINNSSCSQCIYISGSAQFSSIGNFVFDGFNNKTKIGYNFVNSTTPVSGFRNQPSNSSLFNFDVCCKLDNSTFFNTGGDFYSSNTGIQLINSSLATLNVMNLNCTTNINCDATSSIFTNGILMNDISNISISNINNVSIDYFEEELDSLLGRHILGNFINGSKYIPSRSFLGNGSYQYNGIVFFKYNGSTFTTVTNNLKPSSGTTTTLFDNLTNSVFYIGDSIKFSSLNVLINTVLSGTLIVEFWNGAAWTAIDHMSSQAVSPYGCYANNLFSVAAAQDIRFDIRLITNYTWTASSVNGTTKYWIRLRPSGTITTSPVLNYMRLLYDSTQIDDNGINLYYGSSRSYQQIPFDTSYVLPSGSTIQNQDVFLSKAVGVGKLRNKLQQGDSVGYVLNCPVNLDSSSPLIIYFGFISSSSGASQANFSLNINIAPLITGQTLYLTSGSAPETSTNNYNQTLLLTPNQTNGNNFVNQRFEFPIRWLITRNSSGLQNQLLGFNFVRNADSNGGNLILVSINISYLSFCSGLIYV